MRYKYLSEKEIEEIEKTFPWLKDAKFEDADIVMDQELSSNTVILVWNGGTWIMGTWKDGIWKDGVWETGRWEYGRWENGTWKDGIWETGIWHKGIGRRVTY